jgi:hypothetical protein
MRATPGAALDLGRVALERIGLAAVTPVPASARAPPTHRRRGTVSIFYGRPRRRRIAMSPINVLRSMRTLLMLGFGVAIILFAAPTASAKTPDGLPPSQETVCSGLTGAAFGLCNAYCEAQDCDVHPRPSCPILRRNFARSPGVRSFPAIAAAATARSRTTRNATRLDRLASTVAPAPPTARVRNRSAAMRSSIQTKSAIRPGRCARGAAFRASRTVRVKRSCAASARRPHRSAWTACSNPSARCSRGAWSARLEARATHWRTAA